MAGQRLDGEECFYFYIDVVGLCENRAQGQTQDQGQDESNTGKVVLSQAIITTQNICQFFYTLMSQRSMWQTG